MCLEQRTQFLRWSFQNGQGQFEEVADEVGLIELPAFTNPRYPCVVVVRQLHGDALVRLLTSRLGQSSVNDLANELMVHFIWSGTKPKVRRCLAGLRRLL